MPARKMPDAEVVRRLYWDEQLGTREIGARLGVPAYTVQSFMRRHNIARRTRGEGTRLLLAQGKRKAPPPGAALLKSELHCRGCGAVWAHDNRTQRTACPYCGKFKDARDRRANARAYARAKQRQCALDEWTAQPENRRKRRGLNRELFRKRLFFRITGSIIPLCARCGCDDPRLLEINHKNGQGNKEMQHGKNSMGFYRSIVNGTRKTDDLELLCKPCNAVHYLELIYGSLPLRVVWEKDRP